VPSRTVRLAEDLVESSAIAIVHMVICKAYQRGFGPTFYEYIRTHFLGGDVNREGTRGLGVCANHQLS
jgi:hypothetical protein